MAELKPAPRMTLITLGVNDLKASTKFYQEGLGWPLSSISNDHVSFFELQGNAYACLKALSREKVYKY